MEQIIAPIKFEQKITYSANVLMLMVPKAIERILNLKIGDYVLVSMRMIKRENKEVIPFVSRVAKHGKVPKFLKSYFCLHINVPRHIVKEHNLEKEVVEVKYAIPRYQK